MLVGNGYVPGHAAYALELLRADAGVRGLFERTARDGARDHEPRDQRRQARARPGDRPQARTLARKVGQPIVKLAKQHTTVSVERATLRLAGLAGADADGTPVGQPARRRASAPTSASSTASPCPVWDALLPRRGRRPAHPGPEGLRRLGPVPRSPRAGTPTARRAASPRARSAPASRRIDARRTRARADDRARSATPRASRGST